VLKPITNERWSEKDYFECSFRATHRVTLEGLRCGDAPRIRNWRNRHYKAKMKIFAEAVITDEILEEEKNERL
jgi:hypothetical protein